MRMSFQEAVLENTGTAVNRTINPSARVRWARMASRSAAVTGAGQTAGATDSIVSAEKVTKPFPFYSLQFWTENFLRPRVVNNHQGGKEVANHEAHD